MAHQGNPSPVPPSGSPFPLPGGPPPPGQHDGLQQQYQRTPPPPPDGASGFPPQHGQFPPQPQQQGPYSQPPHLQDQHGPPPTQSQYTQQPFPPQGQYLPLGQQYPQPPPQQFYQPQQHHQPQQPLFGHEQQQPPYGYPHQQPQQVYGHGAPLPQAYGAPGASGAPQEYMSLKTDADAEKDVDALRKAMKGRFSKDEGKLIEILCKADGAYALKLRETFKTRLGRVLENDVSEKISGGLKKVLLACLRGPLMHDAHAVNTAVDGFGTNEDLLNDVLCGRSNADLTEIKKKYREIFGKSLEKRVAGDVSGLPKQLFAMITAGKRAEEFDPVFPQAINKDVEELKTAFKNIRDDRKSDSDVLAICRIFSSRSDAQLRAVEQGYNSQPKSNLAKEVSSGISGDAKDTLLAILSGATDPVNRDVKILDEALNSSKTDLAVEKMVRLHWNKPYLQQVKAEFRKKNGMELSALISKKTSGDYTWAMLALLE